MTVKKTMAKGKLFNYLGRFRKQKFLDQGHNGNFFEDFAELITPLSTAVTSITGVDVFGNQKRDPGPNPFAGLSPEERQKKLQAMRNASGPRRRARAARQSQGR
jgi:hypothetical protein